MSGHERDRVQHFRQRWAEENFNASINLPSSSSGTSNTDHNLTEVTAPAPAPAPLRSAKSSDGFYRTSPRINRSWRDGFGLSRSQEHLTEVAAPRPVQSSQLARPSRPLAPQPRNSDEDTALPAIPDYESSAPDTQSIHHSPPRWLTEIYTISWLIFFSLLGTLSRLGVEAITQYPNAPVTSRVLWANLGGSFVMGFLSEDKSLFRKPRPSHREKEPEEESAAEYNKWKKTIPLYIGLTTGYCGSFTSFSSFIRDAFLALTNDLDSPSLTTPYHAVGSINPRNGGFSFLATLAILIIHPAVSIAALRVGAHSALFLRPVTPNIHRKFVTHFLNPLIVPLGIGCWLGASLVLSIVPPYNTIEWRTRAMFPLIFSPPGCLLRYYLSKHLNPIASRFPLGTFTSNVFGTMVLGMCFDLQHADLSGLGVHSMNACAVLAGIEEGFCGCLTTVSTWVVELTTLQRKSAWTYGLTTVAVSLAAMVCIMGGMGWTVGFGVPSCG